MRGANEDQQQGIAIACRAREEPLRQIVANANAGAEPSVMLQKMLEGEGSYGYNAAGDRLGGLIDMGVLDPTKVTRLALQNAASVAGLTIMTEAAVSDEVAKEKESAS